METARGVEYGAVVLGPKDLKEEEIVQPLKPVIRIATSEDDKIEAKNKEKEKEAYKICLEKIAKHVRQGAMSYLKQQYKVVGIVFLFLVILFALNLFPYALYNISGRSFNMFSTYLDLRNGVEL